MDTNSEAAVNYGDVLLSTCQPWFVLNDQSVRLRAQGCPPEASAARIHCAECLLTESALPPGFPQPRGL